MSSVTVLFKTDSHYQVNRDRIRSVIERVLVEKKAKGLIEVSVAVVGDRKMRALNLAFRKIDTTTDILSFPQNDSGELRTFVNPPDNILRLGDIVLSYPMVIQEAAEYNAFVDELIDELIEHGMLHLLGFHDEAATG